MKLRKIIFLACLVQVIFAVPSLTITQGKTTSLVLSPDESYYGSELVLNVVNDSGSDMQVLASINNQPREASGFEFPAETVSWKAHYIDPTRGSFLKGTVDKVAYRTSDDVIAVVHTGAAATDIKIGTSISHVPAVQPARLYNSVITFKLQ